MSSNTHRHQQECADTIVSSFFLSLFCLEEKLYLYEYLYYKWIFCKFCYTQTKFLSKAGCDQCMHGPFHSLSEQECFGNNSLTNSLTPFSILMLLHYTQSQSLTYGAHEMITFFLALNLNQCITVVTTTGEIYLHSYVVQCCFIRKVRK